MKNVVLVAVSDLHLDHRPPPARAERGDEWYGVMERQLAEVFDLCCGHEVPLVVAGDVFNDGWRPHRTPPELINFAIRMFSEFPHGVYAVPGQHDLPYHRYADKEKSAYWTLCSSGAIVDLPPGSLTSVGRGVHLRGFPWGSEIPKISGIEVGYNFKNPPLRVAVVHRYCWSGEHRHPGARPEDDLAKVPDRFPGFDVVLFGDNHKGFLSNDSGGKVSISNCGTFVSISNCGTFVRRASDEKDYRPFATLVYDDGTVRPHFYTSVEKDKWVNYEGAEKANSALDRFADALAEIKTVHESFDATLEDEMRRRGIKGPLREAVLDAVRGEG